MAKLRAPDGCPWDRAQTMDSIKTYTLEETYEVFEAIESGDMRGLQEELGDFILQAVFYAQIASESGAFTIADSLQSINEKLIRRHPHIFGDAVAKTPDDVKLRWDEIKAREKAERGEAPKALLDEVPKAMPALQEAQDLTAKAAKVRFDWPETDQVIAKIHEELAELEEARRSGDQPQIQAEMGDLLFAVVNLARHVKVPAEQALRGANRKFRRRFGYIERTLGERRQPWSQTTLDEMEALWQEAKREE